MLKVLRIHSQNGAYIVENNLVSQNGMAEDHSVELVKNLGPSKSTEIGPMVGIKENCYSLTRIEYY